MDTIVVKAQGKINLSLDVLGRRDDGYHNIRSVMQSIALYDRLKIRKTNSDIKLITNFNFTSTTNNLAYRAAQLFFSATNIKAGVSIELEKGIPISAGLGGGSADAAAVLWCLNQLYKTNLSIEELQNLAYILGADIPFCLQGGTLLAEGIGEKLSLLPPMPDCVIVLVKPSYSISTQNAYQQIQPSMFGDYYTTPLIGALEENLKIADCLGNILEEVGIKQVPEIQLWKERLLKRGALGCLMSGSGPTVFGIFASQKPALEFLEEWQDQQCWMTATRPWNAGITVVKE